MTDTMQGICTTYNDGPTCVRQKYHGQPVWYCEEFDSCAPPAAKDIVNKSVLEPVSALRDSKEKELESAKYSGLCINCGDRKICTFSKLELEIWQCNEYV